MDEVEAVVPRAQDDKFDHETNDEKTRIHITMKYTKDFYKNQEWKDNRIYIYTL